MASLAGEVVEIELPPLPENDPLFHEKKRLLQNLPSSVQVPVSSSATEVHEFLDLIVRAARVLHMNEVELYFSEEDDVGPFSPRSELQSLFSVLECINSKFSLLTSGNASDTLQILKGATLAMIRSVGLDCSDCIQKTSDDYEGPLLKWGMAHGVQVKLKIASFEGAGRGAVASEDLEVGDVALEIPESLIISEDLVCESDIFTVLRGLDGISAETMMLLWSMRERHDSASKFSTYFAALPEVFNTGLSFTVGGLAALEGSLLFEELVQAKEHLHREYEELFPMLCLTYPNIFKPELYTWEHFLWACELWYSNSMKVVLSSGELKTCLIPIAGFLNHSLSPHIINYGRVDQVSKSLKFSLLRPCKAGEQCFLSYGCYPASKLVTFYGFIPKGRNPYDVIPIDIDVSEEEDSDSSSEVAKTMKIAHMVRGTWLSKQRKAQTYGLPTRLLSHLHAVLGSNAAEAGFQHSALESERLVLETLLSVFQPMLEGLGESGCRDCRSASWDVKLALEYMDLQRQIVSSVVDACTSALGKHK